MKLKEKIHSYFSNENIKMFDYLLEENILRDLESNKFKFGKNLGSELYSERWGFLGGLKAIRCA